MAVVGSIFYVLSGSRALLVICLNWVWVLTLILATVVQCWPPKKPKPSKKEKSLVKSIQEKSNGGEAHPGRISLIPPTKRDDEETPSCLKSKGKRVKSVEKIDIPNKNAPKIGDFPQSKTKKKGPKTLEDGLTEHTQDDSARTQLITPTWLNMKPIAPPPTQDDDRAYFQRSVTAPSPPPQPRQSSIQHVPSILRAPSVHVVGLSIPPPSMLGGVVTAAIVPSTRTVIPAAPTSIVGAVSALPEAAEDRTQPSDSGKKPQKTDASLIQKEAEQKSPLVRKSSYAKKWKKGVTNPKSMSIDATSPVASPGRQAQSPKSPKWPVSPSWKRESASSPISSTIKSPTSPARSDGAAESLSMSVAPGEPPKKLGVLAKKEPILRPVVVGVSNLRSAPVVSGVRNVSGDEKSKSTITTKESTKAVGSPISQGISPSRETSDFVTGPSKSSSGSDQASRRDSLTTTTKTTTTTTKTSPMSSVSSLVADVTQRESSPVIVGKMEKTKSARKSSTIRSTQTSVLSTQDTNTLVTVPKTSTTQDNTLRSLETTTTTATTIRSTKDGASGGGTTADEETKEDSSHSTSDNSTSALASTQMSHRTTSGEHNHHPSTPNTTKESNHSPQPPLSKRGG